MTAKINSRHRVIEAPDDLTFWILVAHGEIFFAGYAFTVSHGTQPMASKNRDDAWMIETEEQAVLMTKEDPRLKEYIAVKVEMKKRTVLALPNTTRH